MFLSGLRATALAARTGAEGVAVTGCSVIGTATMALVAFAHTHTWELPGPRHRRDSGAGWQPSSRGSRTAEQPGTRAPEQPGRPTGTSAPAQP